jgi:hypothetical protein
VSREENMVVIARDDAGTPTIWCDPEIADIVAALNASGIATVASCSGHGHRPGRISLADGRELILPRDAVDTRLIEAAFPTNINGERVPAQPVDETERLRAHIAEQIEHVEQRIKDGVEMGATIWRIALEDVARENRAALQHMGEVSRG